MQRKYTILSLARFVWLLLAGLALVVQAVSLYISLEAIYLDPQLASSFPEFRTWLSYGAFVLLVLSWRLLTMLVCWLAAVLIFWKVGRREGEATLPGLFTSLLLAFLPQLLIFSRISIGAGQSLPLQAVWSAGVQFFIVLTLFMLGLFYFIFPDGRPVSVWMRRVAGFLIACLLILVFIQLSGFSDAEWLWPIGFLSLLAVFLTGAANQVYRYIRLASPVERRQTKWTLLALVLLPFGIILSSGYYGSSQSALVGFLSSNLISIFLPLSLLAAVFLQGLWQVEIPARTKQQYIFRAGILALVLFLGLVLAYQAKAARSEDLPTLTLLPDSDRPRPVIIDTDMAPDDWVAILYLLQRPDVQVLAITVEGTGEAHCRPGVRNALRLVALSGGSSIPVACGREIPLQGKQEFPPAWREQSDNLAGIKLPESQNPVEGTSAADLLQSMTLDASGRVTLVTLGPLTNLAEAILENAGFLDKVEQIYIMGGALEVLGNVGFSGVGIDNQVAEWNIFVDPLAFQVVLASGAPITLVPLDATNQVPARLEFFRRLEANRRTAEARFVYDVLATQLGFIASGGYSFWDPLTASIFVDESLGYIKEGEVKIFTSPGTSSGLTRLMPGGFPVRYVKAVATSRFEDELLNTLNQP